MSNASTIRPAMSSLESLSFSSHSGFFLKIQASGNEFDFPDAYSFHGNINGWRSAGRSRPQSDSGAAGQLTEFSRIAGSLDRSGTLSQAFEQILSVGKLPFTIRIFELLPG